MVNFPMFASEIPNKAKALGFAATNRWSVLVTTIASGELANNSVNHPPFREMFPVVFGGFRRNSLPVS